MDFTYCVMIYSISDLVYYLTITINLTDDGKCQNQNQQLHSISDTHGFVSAIKKTFAFRINKEEPQIREQIKTLKRIHLLSVCLHTV